MMRGKIYPLADPPRFELGPYILTGCSTAIVLEATSGGCPIRTAPPGYEPGVVLLHHTRIV